MQRWLCLFLLLTDLQLNALQTDALTLVRAYVEARNQTMGAAADSKTIERALAYCGDDLVYEHPAVKARIEGKQEIRAGMMGYLGQTKNPSYQIRIIANRADVVVAQVHQRFLVKQDDGSWRPGIRSNLTVFEIANGKIQRILDY
jgi:ketosteroid isomerase-like protein